MLFSSMREKFSIDFFSGSNYLPYLNCHWTVTAPAGKIVKLRFTEFSLERRHNGTDHLCWDYVEVRDGEGPYSPIIGR